MQLLRWLGCNPERAGHRLIAYSGVGILIAAFDAAWHSIKGSGAHLSDKQIELTQAILAKYIIEQARHGERDQCRLRDGALLHLAQSNLRYPPRDWNNLNIDATSGQPQRQKSIHRAFCRVQRLPASAADSCL